MTTLSALLLPIPAGAQTDDPVASVQQFLWVAYPDLRDRPVTLTITTWPKPLSMPWNGIKWFGVKLLEDLPRPQRGEAEILTLDVMLNARFMRIRANGTLVNTERHNQIVRQLQSQPQLNQEELLATVRRAGATYVPPQVTENGVERRVRDLEPYLGRFQIDSVEFEVRDDHSLVAGRPLVVLMWSVALTAGDGTTYNVNIEPFDGRIVSVNSSNR